MNIIPVEIISIFNLNTECAMKVEPRKGHQSQSIGQYNDLSIGQVISRKVFPEDKVPFISH